ncbi:hypothetical protein H1C71_018442, partial [Ictidomys tridecemlineatus]
VRGSWEGGKSGLKSRITCQGNRAGAVSGEAGIRPAMWLQSIRPAGSSRTAQGFHSSTPPHTWRLETSGCIWHCRLLKGTQAPGRSPSTTYSELATHPRAGPHVTEGCHGSLITSSHNHVQRRKRRKGSKDISPCLLFSCQKGKSFQEALADGQAVP